MLVRPGTDSDIERLMEVYREAREIMLSIGNVNQWKSGHPSEEILRDDIAKGYCRAVEDSGVIVGAFAFIPGKDPTYGEIEGGEWLDDVHPYVTIHRLASTIESSGVAQTCFEWCWNNCHNLRVDTHEDNSIMRHCILKAGFSYCGIIHLLNGDQRMAYQKIEII